MNKNTSKLKQIAIILLFIIIIAIGAYFNNEEENQTGNNVEYNKIGIFSNENFNKFLSVYSTGKGLPQRNKICDDILFRCPANIKII